MKTIKAAQNPNATLGQMLNTNPQFKQAVNYINQNGGNAKEAFYKLANESGINPDDILSQLR